MQDLAEKLLARLQRAAGERWEAKLALLQLTYRIVGMHRLLLLNFYPLLQKYLQPHQRDVPALLAVLVQVSCLACPLSCIEECNDCSTAADAAYAVLPRHFCV